MVKMLNTVEHLEHSSQSEPLLLYDLERQDQNPHQHQNQDSEQVQGDNGDAAAEILETKVPEKRSTKFLDGLRGVACLCVFTQHLMGFDEHIHGFGENGHYVFISLPFIRVFYNGGGAAVATFFVLSGFVLSQSSVRAFKKGQPQKVRTSLMSAVIRRPLRLYLPCFGIGLIIALAMHLPYNIYPDLGWSHAQDTLWAELGHYLWTFITYFNPFRSHAWVSGAFSYDVVVWTIPIELKGSMLIYGLLPICLFGMINEVWAVGLLLGMIVGLLQIGWWTGACFIGGLVLSLNDFYELDERFLLYRLGWKSKAAVMHVLFILGWYLLSQPTLDGHRDWSLDTPGWHFLTLAVPSAYTDDDYYRFWQSYGALFMVYIILHLRWLQWIFNTRPLQYLGRVSFMLYLVHLPLWVCVGERLFRVFGHVLLGSGERLYDNKLYIPDIGPLGLNLRWDVIWILMLAITLAVSHVGTLLLDEPSVRLGKFLSKKIGLS